MKKVFLLVLMTVSFSVVAASDRPDSVETQKIEKQQGQVAKDKHKAAKLEKAEKTQRQTANDKDLATRIAKQTGIDQGQIEKILSSFKDQVIGSLKAGEEVRLSNFGKFYSKHMDAREVRNPKTGKATQVSSRNYLRFKAFASGNKQLN